MCGNEIVCKCLSMIDGFDGSDDEYIEILKELAGELAIRIEGKIEELKEGL
mgnify:FL=1